MNQTESLKDLVADMRGGKVDMLIILGGNPAYDAPADFGFADALKNTNIPLRVHLGLYQNETAELCQWHVNEAHYLEAWGDGRAYDGTVSIVQPLIAPLYDGKSALRIGFDAFRASRYRRPRNRAGLLEEAAFRRGLRRILAKIAARWLGGRHHVRAETGCEQGGELSRAVQPSTPRRIEINFRRDPSIYDGQFSNNGWLQELPKPMNKLTWDNPVLMGPAMAERMGIKTEDLVELELNGKKVTAPVWIQVGPSRQFHHRVFGLRTAPRRTGRHWRRFRYVSAAHQRHAVVYQRCDDSQGRRHLQAGLHAGLPDHGHAHRHAPAGAHCELGGIPQGTGLRAGKKSRPRN